MNHNFTNIEMFRKKGNLIRMWMTAGEQPGKHLCFKFSAREGCLLICLDMCGLTFFIK